MKEIRGGVTSYGRHAEYREKWGSRGSRGGSPGGNGVGSTVYVHRRTLRRDGALRHREIDKQRQHTYCLRAYIMYVFCMLNFKCIMKFMPSLYISLY